MKYILSFDIAKGKSVYCFIDEKKNIIRDATLIEHKKDEFDELFKFVSQYKNLTVIMESTSIYHLPVENYFRSKVVETIVLNPKLVKQYRDTLNKSKTDKLLLVQVQRNNCQFNAIISHCEHNFLSRLFLGRMMLVLST